MILEKIKKVFNISESQVCEILRKQDHKCPICEKPISLDDCHIEHQHDTNRLRGFTCPRCNVSYIRGLNQSVIDNLYKYIKNPPAF